MEAQIRHSATRYGLGSKGVTTNSAIPSALCANDASLFNGHAGFCQHLERVVSPGTNRKNPAIAPRLLHDPFHGVYGILTILAEKGKVPFTLARASLVHKERKT